MGLSINPLDKVVEDLCENQAYLTPGHKVRLVSLLGDFIQANAESATEHGAGMPGRTLQRQIEKQFQILDRMQNAALTQEHVDFADQKAVMASAKQLIDMMQKLKSDMERESREKLLEDAIKATFDDMGDPTLKVKFMNILRTKLTKNVVPKAA